jgi:hypothetical protein
MTTPTVGGLDSDNVPWTGGKRVSGKNTIPSSPYCSRPTSSKDSLKIYSYATSGLDMKYTGKSEDMYMLHMFGAAVLDHLKKTGMDSVFYFKDPVDGVEKNIIEFHSRFTLEYIKSEVGKYEAPDTTPVVDNYDIQNLEWSSSFLKDSLGMEQLVKLGKFMNTSLSGPILWMYIVLGNQSDSARALRTLINDLQMIKLSDYPGENVATCTNDLYKICIRLDNAGRLPEDVGSTICKALTKCSVEDFRVPFVTLRSQLDANPNYMSYETIIVTADQSYQSLIDSGDWLKENVPSEGDIMLLALKAEIVQLRQAVTDQGDTSRKRTNRDISKVTCFKCKKKGHYANKCPNARSGSADSESEQEPWKGTPPGANEAQIKTVDGDIWKWCGKCHGGRWTSSHTTAEHNGPVTASSASTGGTTDPGQDANTNTNPSSSFGPVSPEGNFGGITGMGGLSFAGWN